MQNDIKTINILGKSIGFFAFVIYVLLFLFIGDRSTGEFPSLDITTLILLLGIPLSGFFLSYMIFKKKTSTISDTKETQEQIAAYRGAYILKYAILEGFAIIIAVVNMFFLDGNIYRLLGGLVLIVMIFISNPSEEEFKSFAR